MLQLEVNSDQAIGLLFTFPFHIYGLIIGCAIRMHGYVLYMYVAMYVHLTLSAAAPDSAVHFNDD